MPKRIVVQRFDFPYRKAGRKAPDRAPVLIQAVNAEAAAFVELNRVKPENVILGGRSMGGRMCSIAVAEGLPAKGLVLISYPLHPPGQPEKLRVDHFKNLTVPCLFVSGDRDAFGTPAEMKKHLRKIKGDVMYHVIAGADHGMKKGQAEMVEVVADWIKQTT